MSWSVTDIYDSICRRRWGTGKIYHVYVDGKHVGKVNDKTAIQNLMETKVEKKKEKFDNSSLSIGENVSLVPERVFDPSYDNSGVSTYLKDELSVKAEAVELKIGDSKLAILKMKKRLNKL